MLCYYRNGGMVYCIMRGKLWEKLKWKNYRQQK